MVVIQWSETVNLDDRIIWLGGGVEPTHQQRAMEERGFFARARVCPSFFPEQPAPYPSTARTHTNSGLPEGWMSRWLGLPTSRAATRPPFHFLIPALLLSSATTAAASASAIAGASSRAAAFVISPSRPPLPIVVGQAIPAAASFLRPLRPAVPRAMTITSSAAASSSSSSSPGATPTPTTDSAAPPTKRLTLLFVRRANPETGAKEVLLGMKKRGFGQGKWNGFGGKVEPGETVEAAALRELEEESCVRAAGAELRGKITFTFLTIPDVLVRGVPGGRGCLGC